MEKYKIKVMNMNNLKKMTIKQLQKVYNDSYVEIQEKQNTKKNKEMKRFIGKYYKYRNCYSYPQEEKDYWWLYLYVTKVEDGCLHVFEFQKDSCGKITIEDNARMGAIYEKYIECTVEEFYGAWKDLMDNINLPPGLEQ